MERLQILTMQTDLSYLVSNDDYAPARRSGATCSERYDTQHKIVHAK